jgi:uncharacterized protein YutE (UPF0331/DUF86 family)
VVAAKAGRARAWLNDAAALQLIPLEACDTATALRAAAGLRNRIGHGYALLDYDRVHREAQTGIPALRSFLVAIVAAAGV